MNSDNLYQFRNANGAERVPWFTSPVRAGRPWYNLCSLPMEPNRTVSEAAKEFIDDYGAAAVEVIQARAKAAADLGDAVAARTWRKTAEAAEEILRQQQDRSPSKVN